MPTVAYFMQGSSLSMISSETVGGLLSKQLKENPHRETKKNESMAGLMLEDCLDRQGKGEL